MNKALRRLRVLLLCIAVIGALGGLSSGAAAGDPPAQGRGRILVIRGVFNVFSWGMDDLACKLAQRGYRVDVAPPSMGLIAAETIKQEYIRDPSTGPVVIIGHSLGGRLCCTIPWRWKDRGIHVALAVILDANPHTPLADNVARCVNLYVTNSIGVFHGREVGAADPQATTVVNLDMTKVTRPPGVVAVDHFNIDDSAWIHSLVIEEIDRALGGPPAKHAAAKPRVWNEE